MFFEIKKALIVAVILFSINFLLAIFLKLENVILIGIGIGLIGVLMNFIAVIANGGKMPIVLSKEEAKNFKDKNYCIANSDTRYLWLADRFCFLKYSYSVGDIFLGISFVIGFVGYVFLLFKIY